MGKPPFDAVFVDFYGTLTAGDRAAVAAACRRIVGAFGLAMTAEDLAIRWGEQFFQTVDASNHETFRSLYECECISLQQTLGPLVGAFDPSPFVEILESYWRDPPLHPDVEEFFERLPLPVCCVSNADAAPLLAAIAKHRLSFNAVVSSEFARCYKPSAGIFEAAARAMGVNPQRVLHIGDSLHSDVGGASSLKIRTAFIQRSERIHDIGSIQADHSIHSLLDALELLGHSST